MFRPTEQPVQNYDKQKEYQRQQDRLRSMVANPNKPTTISADIMIEGLLSNKNTFKKATPQTHNNASGQNMDDFPKWLQPNSLSSPSLYKTVWLLVKDSTVSSDLQLADTQKTSKLLLTSGLHVDVLGFIWNIANKTVPGQLTQFELNLVLALVGLAQSGCTFNNLSVFNLIPSPPIPMLNIDILQQQQQHSSPVVDDFQDFQSLNKPSLPTSNKQDIQPKTNSDSTLITEELQNINKTTNISGIKDTRHFPCIGSSPTADMEQADDDFTDFQSSIPAQKPEITPAPTTIEVEDDFTDFQNADVNVHVDPFETTVVSHKKHNTLPILSFPKLNLKPKSLNLPADSEKKLKTISQSDVLSTLPESKISSDNRVSTMPNIAVFAGSRGVGSRLAHHSLDLRLDKSKHCHRHHKSKTSPVTSQPQPNVDELVIKSQSMLSSDLEDMFPKCKNGSFILKETKIKTHEYPSDVTLHDEQTRQIEIPCLGMITETSLPSQNKKNIITLPKVELMSVADDKYSALRDLVLNSDSSSMFQSPLQETETVSVSDDFGDFLSADSVPVQETKVESDWTSWSNNEQTLSDFKQLELTDSDITKKETEVLFKPNIDLFDLSFPIAESAITQDHTSSLHELIDNSNNTVEDEFEAFQSAFEVNTEATNIISIIEDKFDTFQITETKPDKIVTGKPIDWTNININMRSNFGTELNELMPVSDVKTVDTLELALSRHSSLPSLDFKISPNDDCVSKELILKKTLDCCLNLLQEGVELFENITSEVVLNEVFTTRQAVDYIKNLNIVYYISGRVGRSVKDEDIQTDIRRIWSHLQALGQKYNIMLEDDMDQAVNEDTTCSICYTSITPNTIQVNDAQFHPSCANLWINCVESTLPVTTSI